MQVATMPSVTGTIQVTSLRCTGRKISTENLEKFDFLLFTRNAWLQLVDGQVLILNFIFNSANSTNLIFVISHFALRYENLSLESE